MDRSKVDLEGVDSPNGSGNDRETEMVLFGHAPTGLFLLLYLPSFLPQTNSLEECFAVDETSADVISWKRAFKRAAMREDSGGFLLWLIQFFDSEF
jgi:hypothetical protein